jgi:hypothetical protein
VFDHVIAALVHGSGYERLASPGCSDRTIRRRLREWATVGHGPALHLHSWLALGLPALQAAAVTFVWLGMVLAISFLEAP